MISTVKKTMAQAHHGLVVDGALTMVLKVCPDGTRAGCSVRAYLQLPGLTLESLLLRGISLVW